MSNPAEAVERLRAAGQYADAKERRKTLKTALRMNPVTDDRLQEIAERWLRQHGQCHVNFVHWAIEDSEARVENLKAALREAADAARREEREALRERLAGDVEHWKSESQKGPIPWSSNCDGSAHEARNLLAWLDARSRAEEPK